MRLQLEATPQELNEKGDELIKALVRELYPTSPELAENLEKALPKKEPVLKYRALRDIHKITKEEYEKTLERMHLDISRVLSEAANGPSTGITLEKSETLEKAGGPFIGPRGGKWADAQHTISWDDEVPHEQIQEDAHAAVKEQVTTGAMRAAAAGAHASSLRYVGSGGEGMVFADEQGKAHKVSRNRRPGAMQKLRNEAEANQALMGTPAEQYVAKVHNYNPEHDVLTRNYVQGRPGTWGSQGLREAYDVIAKELDKKGWTAPEFKEDSFIQPEGGGPPKMVDLGFVNPKGAVLVSRLKERIENLDPKDDFFDLNLDITYAYNEGDIDLLTAMGYLNTAISKLGQDERQAEAERKELAFSAKMKGDLKEGQTWKDVRIPETSLETKPDKTKPKVRTPVKSKQIPENAPLPGQGYLFDKNKVVLRKPEQQSLPGISKPVPKQKPTPDDNAPLPGQLPLIKAMPIDPVQDIIDRESVGYRRIKELVQRKLGYSLESFEPGGALYGKSTNELLNMVREKQYATD